MIAIVKAMMTLHMPHGDRGATPCFFGLAVKIVLFCSLFRLYTLSGWGHDRTFVRGILRDYSCKGLLRPHDHLHVFHELLARTRGSRSARIRAVGLI